MEIYVLKEGVRRGPFLPFKLRELLEDNEFLPSDPGWIVGMENWEPLSSIEALEHWMPRDPSLPPPLPDADADADAETETHSSPAKTATAPDIQDPAEVAARRLRAWLRWFARTLDEMLWFALIWLVGVSAGWLGLWDFLVRHPVLLLGPCLLWIPVEAWMLSRFTTTPGKWLLGMQVTDDLGQPLTYQAALKRSALVLVTGNGLGLPFMLLLPVLQAAMSWMLYRRTGTTLWDRAAGSQLRHIKPAPVGIGISAMVILLWMVLGSWITFTAPLPVNFPEDQRQQIEQMRRQLDDNFNRLRQPATPPRSARAVS